MAAAGHGITSVIGVSPAVPAMSQCVHLIIAAAGLVVTGTDLSPAIPGMGVSMPLHQAGGRQHPLGSSLKQGSSIEQQEQQHGHHLHHHHHQHQHQHQQHQQQVVGQCMGRHPMHWKLIDFGNAVVLGHGAVALHGAGTQHSGDLHIEGGSSVDRPGSNKSQGQSSQASAGGSYAAASQAANASAPKSQPTGLQLPAVMFQSLAYAPPEDCLGIPAAACTQSSTTQSPCHSISVSESYQPGPASQPQHGVPSFAPSSLITLSSKMPLSQSHAHANLLPFSLTPVHSAAHALPPRFQPTVPWAQPANDMWSLGCVLYEASTGLKLMDLPRARWVECTIPWWCLLHRNADLWCKRVQEWDDSDRAAGQDGRMAGLQQPEAEQSRARLLACFLLPISVCPMFGSFESALWKDTQLMHVTGASLGTGGWGALI
eukprot:850593-Pelagomonas_calceolata.AAC.4